MHKHTPLKHSVFNIKPLYGVLSLKKTDNRKRMIKEVVEEEAWMQRHLA